MNKLKIRMSQNVHDTMNTMIARSECRPVGLYGVQIQIQSRERKIQRAHDSRHRSSHCSLRWLERVSTTFR